MTNAADTALLGAVKRHIQRILVATLVAVAMLGGGELPILHAPQFAEAHAFVHTHTHTAGQSTDHDAGHAAAHVGHTTADLIADAAGDPDHGAPSGSDRGCTHVHAHCCAAAAILAVANAYSPEADYRQLRLERNGALPYGQLSRPLLRPPRVLV